MKILVVYPYIPYPIDRGTFQRTFHLLRGLAREHEVDLLALSEGGERVEHQGVFEEFCREVRFVSFQHPEWPKLLSGRLLTTTPATVRHWRRPEIAQAIREQLAGQTYDLVHVCDIVMAQYFLDEHRDIPLSVDRSRVDLQFQLQRTRMMETTAKGRLLAWENMAKLWRYERRIARRAQLQIVCGPDDETFIRKHFNRKAAVQVVANGVDLEYFRAEHDTCEKAEEPTLLFCGAMDYAPNVDALRWYFESVHEDLRARVPHLQVLIVGKSPITEVSAYAALPGVTVTGSVPDVRPYYRRAWAQMVPLRIGGGTRLKILESLAIGTPVVSTTIGAQGLDLRHGHDVLLADTTDAFAIELESILKQPVLRQNLREQGIRTALKRFSWHTMSTALAKGCEDVAKRHGHTQMMQVPFSRVTMKGTLDRIADMIQNRRPSTIATANVDFLVQARKDQELHGFLQKADMVVCDGTPLVWLSRLMGKPLPERVAGSDLVPKLLARAEKEGWSVFFLGGREEVLRQAVKNVEEKHPSLRTAGAYSPPFAPLDRMDNEAICARIREAKPDILLVAFGCPKQEKWIARYSSAANVPVSIGVGATIDFLAGAMQRAPRWMRHAGMEWVFRLAQEPRRLVRRYAMDLLVFGPSAISELILSRFTTSA